MLFDAGNIRVHFTRWHEERFVNVQLQSPNMSHFGALCASSALDELNRREVCV